VHLAVRLTFAYTKTTAPNQNVMKTPLEESPSLLSTHTLPSNATHRAAARSAARPNANASSTLIEFPGTARAQRPAWRKELSERVREIQERRAREAMGDDATQSDSYTTLDHESAAAQGLGLVPPSPTPPAAERQLNPIVVAALARVERARQTPPPLPPPSPALPSPPQPSAATTLAVAAPSPINTETDAQTPKLDAPDAPNSAPASNDSAAFVAKTVDTAPATREVKPHLTKTPTTLGGVDINSPAYLKYKQEEAARAQAKRLAAKQNSGVQTRVTPPASASLATRSEHTKSLTPRPQGGTDTADRTVQITAVRVDATATASPAADARAATRRVNAQVLDDAMLARLDAEEAAAETARRRKSQDDYAPFTARLTAGVIDVISVIFLSSPIAAALELAYGNWSDTRTMMTMTISVITITFLYITAATALAGRTWGMALVNLRAVDVESGMIPTTSQAIRRGAGYVVSLVIFGLGLLYALIDPERRGAHDHFSGTVVVRE
jgi:uncharacterized RDD family membrane protein YckC